MKKIIILHLGQGIKTIEEELNKVISENPEFEFLDFITIPRTSGFGLPNHYAAFQTSEVKSA